MTSNNVQVLLDEFEKNPYYLQMGAAKIAARKKVSKEEVYEAKTIYKSTRNRGLNDHCKSVGIDPTTVKSAWIKSKEFSLNIKNDNSVSLQDLQKELIEEMQEYSPVYPEITRTQSKEPHLLVIDPADIHLGKLATSFETGEAYDNQIAVQRVKEGVQGLLNKASGFNIELILLVIGNDILHIDSPKRTTTSGTFQDTDGMWYENFLLAKQLYVEIIEMLLPVANVHVQYDPSNHDYANGFFLADTLRTWFRQSPNITFNTSIAHRKYFSYGRNLIGTTHGDGAREQDLPLLMAQEAPHEWAQCDHRYIYTHHIHHKRSRDYGSVCVESLRSPSGTDSWHHRNGYQHNPKAVEGFIHHPLHGQIARLTHIF